MSTKTANKKAKTTSEPDKTAAQESLLRPIRQVKPKKLTFNDVAKMYEVAFERWEILHEQLAEPFPNKQPPEFTSSHLCEILDVSISRLNYLLKSREDLPQGKSAGQGRSRTFTLSDVLAWVKGYSIPDRMEKELKLREKDVKLAKVDKRFTVASRPRFSLRAYNGHQCDGKVIFVGVFKGGVGKSVCSVTMAQALTIRGFKVLIIDLDPQGSATALCGIDPATRVADTDTLEQVFETGLSEKIDLKKAGLVKQSYWENLYIIPATTSLYSSELHIPAHVMRERDQETLRNLPITSSRIIEKTVKSTGEKISTEVYTYPYWAIMQYQLEDLKKEFDVILIDTPPSLSYSTMNALMFCDSILVPVPPRTMDFASAVQFFGLVSELSQGFDSENKKEFDFIRVVKTRTKPKEELNKVISDWMDQLFGEFMLDIDLPESKAVENATAELCTTWDKLKPEGDMRAHKRFKEPFDKLTDYIEQQVRTSWYWELVDKGAMQDPYLSEGDLQ